MEENNISKISKSQCCGCGICSITCPKYAITMTQDKEGFLYPTVCLDKCISCKKCLKVCVAYSQDKRQMPFTGYAAINENKIQLSKSASGGVFSAIATHFIQQGGIVCGAVCLFENSIPVIKHIIINDNSELQLLQGSKYVQSDIRNVLTPIRDALNNKKKVLFSGTPCQVAGVRSFLNKEYENFYSIDLICHGVPNAQLFSMYSLNLKKKYGGNIVSFKFRDKEYGWGKYGSFEVEDKGKIKKIPMPCEKSSYYSFLMSSNLQRKSCFSCLYASNQRIGDITIGDYWGIEYTHPEIIEKHDIKLGVSCILVNTKKGQQLVSNYGDDLIIIETGSNDIIENNDKLRQPARKGIYRELIYKLAFSSGSGYWMVEMLFLISRVKNKAQYVLKKWFIYS
ncbi:Coenzyme F420 hydrogenase/dehydrogenase, beta subunit C-terminal domain [Clostridium butyricum]|uniref:Coenzyme F420 hydrogenase/dehydrogenase, beta subunit C-terminal domain n=1 Tax=Clostridium butyricum TaxID=1492 RepID=UPI002ABD933F|nr:Coenzyme F420 hydrogenase/dehydrogenase, beta subunit C-terminal domain [Clostridium butyricum]